jgi:hypothetical protein
VKLCLHKTKCSQGKYCNSDQDCYAANNGFIGSAAKIDVLEIANNIAGISSKDYGEDGIGLSSDEIDSLI